MVNLSSAQAGVSRPASMRAIEAAVAERNSRRVTPAIVEPSLEAPERRRGGPGVVLVAREKRNGRFRGESMTPLCNRACAARLSLTPPRAERVVGAGRLARHLAVADVVLDGDAVA